MCDVYLPKEDISGVHFRIKFSPQGRLTLIDTSSRGMWLSFNGQRKYTLRHDFTWTLPPDIKTIEADFGNDHSPRFELKVPRHTHFKTYQENLKKFQKLSYDVSPSLGSPFLTTTTLATTAQPTHEISPQQRPWYLKEDDREGVLGRGQFGVVYKVREISTNKSYAVKEFLAPRDDVAEKRWRKEIEMIRNLPHDVSFLQFGCRYLTKLKPHIVQFIDSCDEDCRKLVMGYLPRGNLTNEQKRQKLKMEECILLLRQGLQALVHIHSHGHIHRGIKPNNILVYLRTPLHIKLADFGLSRSNSVLFTFYGTNRYLAPEVVLSQTRSYTPLVDVWALGVVVYELAYYLPSWRNHDKPWRWARRIIDTASGCESDKLVDFLRTSLLVMDHRRRLPAEECLKRASQIPAEVVHLQTSLHQADDHGPSDPDFIHKLRGRDLPDYDPLTVQKASNPNLLNNKNLGIN